MIPIKFINLNLILYQLDLPDLRVNPILNQEKAQALKLKEITFQVDNQITDLQLIGKAEQTGKLQLILHINQIAMIVDLRYEYKSG